MDRNIPAEVEKIVGNTVADLGYELADVEFVKESDGWVLTLYIYKDEGISIHDCERVSHAVDPLIDEMDPIEQAYFLSVSSVGLDRPLKKPRDFERNLNRDIDLFLINPIEKKKEFTGKLIFADEEKISIITKGAKKSFARENVSLIRPHISYKGVQ